MHLHWHYIYGKLILDQKHVRYDLDAVHDVFIILRDSCLDTCLIITSTLNEFPFCKIHWIPALASFFYISYTGMSDRNLAACCACSGQVCVIVTTPLLTRASNLFFRPTTTMTLWSHIWSVQPVSAATENRARSTCFYIKRGVIFSFTPCAALIRFCCRCSCPKESRLWSIRSAVHV